MQVLLESIATIHSPFHALEDMPIQPKGAKELCATIEFDRRYQEGLKDLDGFSHIYLIYYFHKVAAPKLTVVPFADKTDTPRGVFATRSPLHPNLLGLSVVELVSIEENIVTIRGVDILDGTPLLDIKPYIENFDKVQGVARSGWMNASLEEVVQHRSDTRFTEN